MTAAWELAAAALFAPVAIWVLWRVQTLAVELLRLRLLVLARRGDTRWLYSTVSFLGVLLHEMSHAAVLLLSGHGIREFRAGREQGHVLPSRMRHGTVGFLSFLAAALAPIFIPPALAVALLLLLVDPGLLVWPVAQPGLAPAVDALKALLLEFPLNLARAIARLDLAHWPHAVAFALLLVALPSARPSHVKGSRFHGTQDEGDVAVLRRRIREQPWPFLLFLLLLTAAYLLVLVLPEAYWWPIAAVWATAAAGILLAVLGALWWSVAGLAAATKAWLGWLGPAAFVAAQAGLRVAAPTWPIEWVNGASLLAWAVVGALLALAFPARRRIPI